jgi:Uncharacterized Fe-S protein
MDLQRIANHLLLSDMNYISSDKALLPELAGKRIFDSPIFGFGDPNDQYLAELSSEDLPLILPKEWFPSVKTIISVFFPYSSELKRNNRIKKDRISYEWLHVRIDGQALINMFLKELKEEIEKEGYRSMIPFQDPRYVSSRFKDSPDDFPKYSSNWSERHVAYACGLGTFSLTRAVITEKGAAGRFGSILTTMETEFTEHHKGLHDNCTMCGACIKKCPVSAISLSGKDNSKCAEHLRNVLEMHDPYYGCSECQVGVPCENKIPKRGRS